MLNVEQLEQLLLVPSSLCEPGFRLRHKSTKAPGTEDTSDSAAWKCFRQFLLLELQHHSCKTQGRCTPGNHSVLLGAAFGWHAGKRLPPLEGLEGVQRRSDLLVQNTPRALHDRDETCSPALSPADRREMGICMHHALIPKKQCVRVTPVFINNHQQPEPLHRAARNNSPSKTQGKHGKLSLKYQQRINGDCGDSRFILCCKAGSALLEPAQPRTRG